MHSFCISFYLFITFVAKMYSSLSSDVVYLLCVAFREVKREMSDVSLFCILAARSPSVSACFEKNVLTIF